MQPTQVRRQVIANPDLGKYRELSLTDWLKEAMAARGTDAPPPPATGSGPVREWCIRRVVVHAGFGRRA